VSLFARLRQFTLVALLALLQAGTPVLAYAKMAQQGGLTQEICSSSGAKKVVIDADGSVREATDDGHRDHCSLCTAPGAVPVSTLIQLHESARHSGALRVGQTCFQGSPALVTPPATGPPARS